MPKDMKGYPLTYPASSLQPQGNQTLTAEVLTEALGAFIFSENVKLFDEGNYISHCVVEPSVAGPEIKAIILIDPRHEDHKAKAVTIRDRINSFLWEKFRIPTPSTPVWTG